MALIIADAYMTSKGFSRISTKKIMERTKLSRNTIFKCLSELDSLDVIKRTRTGRTTIYKFAPSVHRYGIVDVAKTGTSKVPKSDTHTIKKKLEWHDDPKCLSADEYEIGWGGFYPSLEVEDEGT